MRSSRLGLPSGAMVRRSSNRSALAGLLVVGLLATGLAFGCSVDNDETAGGSGPPKAQPSPPIDRRQQGATEGTPGETVITLWSYLRDGMYPLALNAFDPEVVEKIGRDYFLGALSVARGTAVALAPKIVRTEKIQRHASTNARRVRDVALVYVEGKGVQGALTRFVFLVEKSPYGWTVLYDTLIDGSLRSWVATTRETAIDKRNRLPAKQAAQAGADVARLYQDTTNTIAKDFF